MSFARSSSGKISGAGNAPIDSAVAPDDDFRVPRGVVAASLWGRVCRLKPMVSAWVVEVYWRMGWEQRFGGFLGGIIVA